MSADTEPPPPFPTNPTWTWENQTEWREKAVAAQNDFYTKNGGIMFNEMKNYEDIETEILVKAFATNPKTVRTLASSMNMWYSKPERKITIKMRKKIQAHSKSEPVKMNAVYIMSYLKEGQNTAVPVFYFEAADNSVKYIDLTARVYKNWDDFVDSNVIDPSLCCYPVNGHYGQTQKNDTPSFDDKIPLKLFIAESPSCGKLATGLQWTKTSFTYTTYIVMGASIVLTGGSFLSNANWVTKLNAIAQKSNKYLQYANSAATIAMSMVDIHDKLSNGEEIVDEISLIVSNVVSLLTPAFRKYIITRGLGGKDLIEAGFSDLSPMAKIFLYILSFTRCASAFISVISCIGTMLYKYLYDKTITASDYFNLASSLYTCYGAVTSPLTAKKVFEQVQNEYKMEVARSAKKEAALAAVTTEVAAAAAAATAESVKAAGNSDNAAHDADNNKEMSNAVAKSTESNATTDKNGDKTPVSGAGGAGDPDKPTNPNDSGNSNFNGGDAGNPDDTIDPRRNHKIVYDDVGLRENGTPTEEEKIVKKEERERLEAEFEEKYKDDEEAKAGFQYYKSNILAGLDNNDYVVNDQLVRLIKTADDPKELFCELAFTNTTITIKRDVLLINGQLNIDGAAFSAHTNHGSTDIGKRLLEKIQAEKDGLEYVVSGNESSQREKLLFTVAHLDGKDTLLPQADLNQTKNDLKNKYRWTLESDVHNFETNFLRKNGIHVGENLTISHYNRLIQIYKVNQQVEKWKLVEKLVQRLGYANPHAIAGLIEMINDKVDTAYQKMPLNTPRVKFKRNEINQLSNGLDKNDPAAVEFCNSITESINVLKEKYENNDESVAMFKEVAAVEGSIAAACEARGHGVKKYLAYGKSQYPDLSKDEFINTVYLPVQERSGSAYSQDGRRWLDLTQQPATTNATTT